MATDLVPATREAPAHAGVGGAASAVAVRPAGRNRSVGKHLLTAAVLGWFALMILLPTVALARAAFGDGASAFARALWTEEALRAFGLTIALAVAATLVNTLFGLMLAVVLVRQEFPGKALADGLVDLPFAVSPVVAGLMIVILYGPNGPIGRLAESAGFRVVYARPGMVLVNLFVTLPFVVREVVPVLREFGVDQEEVAYTLGAGRWTTFRRVTLPSIRWGLAYGVTLTVARSLGEFGALLVVSGNILGRTQTATLFVHDKIEGFEPEGAYAASVVLAAASFVLLIGMEAVRKRAMSHEP